MSVPTRFTTDLLTRPRLGLIDMRTRLRHFALITYAVPPERVRPHVDPRFDLDTHRGPDGKEVVWVSVVPFEDVDFHLAALPRFKFRFGQTNYRTYVIDRLTDEAAVWFFGTTLGGWPVAIPRYVWRLPWHAARYAIDTRYDLAARRYTRYRLNAHSGWGGAEIELEDTGQPVMSLSGFADLEAALVKLTHPLIGVYYRRDGALGSYRVWHDRLNLTVGKITRARIDLLDRLGIVPFAEQLATHSVLIQPETEFIIQMPPVRL